MKLYLREVVPHQYSLSLDREGDEFLAVRHDTAAFSLVDAEFLRAVGLTKKLPVGKQVIVVHLTLK